MARASSFALFTSEEQRRAGSSRTTRHFPSTVRHYMLFLNNHTYLSAPAPLRAAAAGGKSMSEAPPDGQADQSQRRYRRGLRRLRHRQRRRADEDHQIGECRLRLPRRRPEHHASPRHARERSRMSASACIRASRSSPGASAAAAST